MFRKYLEKELQDWKNELEIAKEEQDEEYINECQEEIEKVMKKDVPFQRIVIDNEITIATLKKIEREGYYNFDDWAEYQQPLENLDNGYITPEYLNKVLRGYFTKKANGKYPNTTKSMFGSTQKIDFIKSKLEELVQ
jgi:hypothetical protein